VVQAVNKIPVVIVDDHAIVRYGLRGLIDSQPDLAVVGEAETGAGALRCVDMEPAAVLILDLELPDISGIEILWRVSQTYPRVRVLVFSSYPADRFAAAILEAGAAAYVCKSAGGVAILEALRLIAFGIEGESPPPLH